MNQARRKAQALRHNAMMREASRNKIAAGAQFASRITSAEIEARLAEIPADTRTLTARTFGDPLPGRSAFDRSLAR